MVTNLNSKEEDKYFEKFKALHNEKIELENKVNSLRRDNLLCKSNLDNCEDQKRRLITQQATVDKQIEQAKIDWKKQVEIGFKKDIDELNKQLKHKDRTIEEKEERISLIENVRDEYFTELDNYKHQDRKEKEAIIDKEIEDLRKEYKEKTEEFRNQQIEKYEIIRLERNEFGQTLEKVRNTVKDIINPVIDESVKRREEIKKKYGKSYVY